MAVAGEESDGGTAKSRVARFLQSRFVEILIVILVLTDIVLVTIESGVGDHIICVDGKQVDYGTPAGQHLALSTSRVSQARTVSRGLGIDKHRTIRAFDTHLLPHDAETLRTNAAIAKPYVAEEHPPVLVCSSKHGEKAKHIIHVCHAASIAILIIFAAEIVAKWWAIPGFLEIWYHQLDLVVVTLSLVIDTVVFWYLNHNGAQIPNRSHLDDEHIKVLVVISLLLLCRTWRVVPICHGLFEEYLAVQREIEEPRDENRKLREALVRLGVDPDHELTRSV